jgi:membrane fusion protein (multidrug efflux system)
MAVEHQVEQEEQAPPRDQNANQRPSEERPNGDSAKKKSSNPRRKSTIRFVVLALLVVAAIVAIPIYAYYSVRESTDDAQVDGHVIPISPRIAGVIVKVLVDDNVPVKAGQELV